MIILDKTIKRSLYLQISDALIKLIEENILTHGEKLPSLTEMSELFDISLKVVTQVYSKLSQEGLIVSRRGQGYYVHRRKEFTIQLKSFNSLEKNITEKYMMTKAILLLSVIDPEPHVINSLHLLPDQKCYKIQQVFTDHSMNYVVQILYFPVHLYDDFRVSYLKHTSLDAFLFNNFNKIKINHQNKFIAMNANNMLATILKLPKHAPLWRIETEIKNQATDQYIVYYESYFSGQDVKMEVELNV